MVVLLLWSIAITRKTPLLNTSVVAFLVCPLKGWKGNEMSVVGMQTSEKLEKLAENTHGKWK